MYFILHNESVILMISWTSWDSQEQVMQMEEHLLLSEK